MKRTLKYILSCALILAMYGSNATARKLNVQIRGVYKSKVKLTPFNGLSFAVPLAVSDTLYSGEGTSFFIPDSLLPGEFLLRFDFCAQKGDYPYPGELQLFINKEDITAYVNPQYLRGDSLILEGDRENRIWWQFGQESGMRQQQIALLGQLLEGYTYTDSKVWKQAALEFEKRRTEYNRWIDSVSMANQGLYVGHLFRFLYMRAVNWEAPPDERFLQQAAHWFDDFDFNDTLVLRSRQMNEYINGYMGLFGSRATTIELRDSLFTEAGRLACERASSGNPKVYGWITDYFYSGFETYNITTGLKMLEQHINNPRCQTSKKQEIARRLEGIKKLVPGVSVPNLSLHDAEGYEHLVDLKSGDKDYRLLVFYESDCSHCHDLLEELRTWYGKPENAVWFSIYTIALDDTQEKWEPVHKKNAFPWTDMYATGGVNSKAASDYYVLSTPNLFLIDKHGKLVNIPDTVHGLDVFLNGNQ